ncbi:MAG: sigma-54 dependent transcriptional regulator [Spirochaetia bacterium]|jgi:DNA-binding NtrC family response regulator
MKGPSVLIVDDEEGIRHGLTNMFRKEGFTVHSAADFETAAAAAAEVPVDVAVVDMRLRTGRTGLDLLTELKRTEPDIVVIVITGFGSIDSAVASMKAGAVDYFLKPIDNAKLLDAVRRSLALRSLATENRFLRDELMLRSLPHQFITNDPALRELLATADKVKDTSVTVLLTGESGTGKEVLARYIHFTGARRDGTFVSINCAALSESLLLSELFGHERGAFTGAVERKRGKFELADGGTLFLDEIGDMSLDTQSKVLRVMEESRFERVGGTKSISVDARIIAATNKDLPALIRQEKFREDLFYRIHVVSLHIPPLRERRGDIPLLVEHFLKKYSERYGRSLAELDTETLSALEAWDWPGNVRELENTVNQMVLLGKRSFMTPGGSGAAMDRSAAAVPAGAASLKEGLDAVASHYERRAISEALARNGGNKSKTARELSITRKTLAQKLARYGISQ